MRNLKRIKTLTSMLVMLMLWSPVAHADTLRPVAAGENIVRGAEAVPLNLVSDETLIEMVQQAMPRWPDEGGADKFSLFLHEFQRRGWTYCIVLLDKRWSGKQLPVSNAVDMSYVNIDMRGLWPSIGGPRYWEDMEALESVLTGEKITYTKTGPLSNVGYFIVNSMHNMFQHVKEDCGIALYLCKKDKNDKWQRMIAIDKGNGFKNAEGEGVEIDATLNRRSSFGKGGYGGNGLKFSLSCASYFRIRTNAEEAVYKRKPENLPDREFSRERIWYKKDPYNRISGVILDAIFLSDSHVDATVAASWAKAGTFPRHQVFGGQAPVARHRAVTNGV